jgi:hypothetical protein
MAGLDCWTIYERPHDYPQGYVLRRIIAIAGTTVADPHAYYGATPEDVRAYLPLGVCLVQAPGVDPDPHIYEVWM